MSRTADAPKVGEDAGEKERRAPLQGVRVVEFSGLGPAPFAGMLLADMGADVVRIDRPATIAGLQYSHSARGKRSAVLDLKTAEGLAQACALCASADILIEGFRPGVMERLGLGPEPLLRENPRLIYGRMTGWGQDGPLSQAAGHDINYIAITGALAAIGPRGGKPVPPLNLVGDFAGGSMFLLYGLLCALHERSASGRGQVVDAAMIDGASALLTPLFEMAAEGQWHPERGSNLLDGGAHFYATYECADGRFICVAALEPQFYALLREKLGLRDPAFASQMDAAAWPALTAKLEALFATRTRAEWAELLEGTDVCFAPVLDFREAPQHAHNRIRGSHIEVDGVLQPAPAPRLSRTPAMVRRASPTAPLDAAAVIDEWRACAQASTATRQQDR